MLDGELDDFSVMDLNNDFVDVIFAKKSIIERTQYK